MFITLLNNYKKLKYNIYLTFNENYFWLNSEVNYVRIYDNFKNPI